MLWRVVREAEADGDYTLAQTARQALDIHQGRYPEHQLMVEMDRTWFRDGNPPRSGFFAFYQGAIDLCLQKTVGTDRRELSDSVTIMDMGLKAGEHGSPYDLGAVRNHPNRWMHELGVDVGTDPITYSGLGVAFRGSRVAGVAGRGELISSLEAKVVSRTASRAEWKLYSRQLRKAGRVVPTGAPCSNFQLGRSVAPSGGVTSGGTANAASGARLNQHLSQVEKYGKGGFRQLENGRYRYYGELSPASKPGEMVGRRVAREWDLLTGRTRTWMETLDADGRVRIVRPETGGPKVHYMFDEFGNFNGTF